MNSIPYQDFPGAQRPPRSASAIARSLTRSASAIARSLTRSASAIARSLKGRRDAGGFTLIELLLGTTILTIGLLAIAAMFPMGYFVVHEAGKMTMTLTATRQILEDIRSVPFDGLTNLNGFDTTVPATLPANAPEREIARRWRYALAGEGDGFTYTTTEKAQWGALSTAGGTFGGRGRITVVAQSPTLRLVTVTVSIPPRWRDVEIATLLSRM